MKYAIISALLCVFMGAAAWWGIKVFSEIRGVEISLHGMIAIGLGVFFTFAVGIGLMTLLFFSNRHGHDEQAHQVFTKATSQENDPL